MNSYHRTTALAVTAGAALAIFATSAGAWDDLPCGATEDAAHVCAPGEPARDGTIPNPLATPPAGPAPAPTAEQIVSALPLGSPAPVASPPPAAKPLTCAQLPRGAGPTWRRKAHCAPPPPPHPPTCADLRARKAGLLWFAKFGCGIPERFRNVGPFTAVPVTG